MISDNEAKHIFHEHGDVLRTSELRNLKIYYADIQRLLEDGIIERVQRGIYYLIDHEDMSETRIVTRLFPEAILCMHTALFYHGYSDRTPAEWHLAVNKNIRKSRFKIEYPFVKPYYIAPSILEIGVMDGEIDENPISIYDKERTLCDCLKRSAKMDKEIFNKAIQGYIKDPQKNIPNLMMYAKILRVEKKVKDMIGVWL